MYKERIIIYPKDIMMITGKSDSHGRFLIRKIRKHLRKEGHQSVTIEEYCSFAGIRIEQVKAILFKRD